MPFVTKVEVIFNAPMPQSEEAMEKRIREMADIRRLCDQELKNLTGSEHFKVVASETKTCLRCGHQWSPAIPLVRPKLCPICRSPGWDRPRQYRMVKVKDLPAPDPVTPLVE